MCACNNNSLSINNFLLQLSAFVIIYCSIFANCYNVDTLNFAKYSSPRGISMFGFTVALHQEGGSNW